jgi:hypothetical protein
MLEVVFRTFIGEESDLAIIASTLAIAGLFEPLRRRIHAFIDRRFYRSKYDARKTLETFSAQLRDETDLDSLSGDLVGVVKETMQPSASTIISCLICGDSSRIHRGFIAAWFHAMEEDLPLGVESSGCAWP